MILPSFHWSKHPRWHGGNSSTRSVGGTSATQTPCELHSVLRINPYNWTFPNCNISFIMDQSTNKTTNEWLSQVAYGKTYSTLGALQFAWQQNHSVGCTKSKDRHSVRRSCLFWSLVFATICPLTNPPNFSNFDDVVLNLRIHSYFFIFFFTSASSCLSSPLLPSSFIIICLFSCTWRRQFLLKALVFPCFLLFRRIGEYISLDLFYQFCQPHSFLKKRECFLSYSWNHTGGCVVY